MGSATGHNSLAREWTREAGRHERERVQGDLPKISKGSAWSDPGRAVKGQGWGAILGLHPRQVYFRRICEELTPEGPTIAGHPQVPLCSIPGSRAPVLRQMP